MWVRAIDSANPSGLLRAPAEPGLAIAIALLVACHHSPRPIAIAPLPRDAYAYYLRGKLALYRDDAGAAARELQAAAKAAPDQPMIVVELARALTKAKQEMPARDVLVEARRRWPDHAQVWLASGEVLEQIGDKPAAIAAYRRAIELEPDEERAYLGLARTQIVAEDQRGAERTLRALVKRVPASVDGHYRLAQRLDQRGDRNAAAAELRAVLEREPDHLDARIDLARTLRRLGKLGEAVDQTRSAFDRAGQPLDIAEELFWLLCEADDRQGAIDLLTLLDDDRSDADALATVAQFQRVLGRTPESRLLAEHIKATDPDASAIVHAETDLAEGLAAQAAARALTIADKSPRFLEARRVAIYALLAARDVPRALSLVTALRASRADDVDLVYLEANVRIEAGDAKTANELAHKLEPFWQARLAEQQGDSQRALQILEPYVRTHHDQPSALNLAGYLLAERHERLADAERYLAQARDLQPGDPQILDSWGWLLFQRGRVREAIRALDHASRFAPREPEILVHLAAAWASDGSPRYAAELLDRAARLTPSPAVARRIDALRAKLVLPSKP